MLKKPTLLLDGDILCYRAAAATDGRQYAIEYEREGQVITQYVKYKKEATKIQQALSKESIDSEVTLSYTPEPLSHAIVLMKRTIKSLETQVSIHTKGLGSSRYFLTRNGSFREKEYPLYKANRKDMRRPANLEGCKEWLENEKSAECKAGVYEADDLMAMCQDDNSIICSIDKDLLQVPGHHFNWVRNEYKVIGEEEGLRSLYMQMLTGDSTDGIPGIKGVGPVTAKKLMKGIHTEFLMYCVVLKEYLKCTKREDEETDEDFQERVVLLVRAHARLLYLMRAHDDDGWTVPKQNEES